jgi:hypothetical protein
MRGRHNHSTLPLAAMSAVTSQSDRNASSAIGGKGDDDGYAVASKTSRCASLPE